MSDVVVTNDERGVATSETHIHHWVPLCNGTILWCADCEIVGEEINYV